MAKSEDSAADSVVYLGTAPPAAADPGLDARLAGLEAAVERLQSELAAVAAGIATIEPKIAAICDALPHLATAADLEKRPTAAIVAAIVAAIAVIALMPDWTAWLAALLFPGVGR